MNFNSLFFPAPQKSYSYLTFFNELIYIPKNITKSQQKLNSTASSSQAAVTVSYIPCLFIPYRPRRNGQVTQQYLKDQEFREKVYKTHKLLIYFHGNAEDIGHSQEFLNQLSAKFHLNVLSVEYPGYGIYRNEVSDSETISQNAEIVFDYAIQSLKFDPKDVVLFGRSMGSGPATLLAELSKPAALILLSPYTSLRDCVKSLLGTLPSLIVKERFKNLDVIRKVTCPTLIVHGQSDTLIPFSHAQQLHMNCGGPSKLIMPKKMTHNEFDLQKDLFEPVKQFFIESNILTSVVRGQPQLVKDKYFVPPRYMREQQEPSSLKSFVTESDHVELDEHRAYDSLKRAKSSSQIVPLIMTQAYQRTSSEQTNASASFQSKENPDDKTNILLDKQLKRNSSSFKLPASFLSLGTLTSSSPNIDIQITDQKQQIKTLNLKTPTNAARLPAVPLEKQLQVKKLVSTHSQKITISGGIPQPKFKVKISFSNNNINSREEARDGSRNREPTLAAVTLIKLKSESQFSSGVGGEFSSRKNGALTSKQHDQATESTIELTQRLEDQRRRGSSFQSVVDWNEQGRGKGREEVVVTPVDNKEDKCVKKITVLDVMSHRLLKQGLSRVEARDKSPIPQSEEKCRFEIKESVRAKNMAGIEPEKRVQLSTSIKNNSHIKHNPIHKVYSPQTARASSTIAKTPLFDISELINLRQNALKSRALQNNQFLDKDLNTDNTTVQDELRHKDDRMQVRVLRGLFDRKSISLSKHQSSL